MWFHEYALKPELRNGCMVNRNSALDFYNRPDSGYFSVYLFDSAATFSIRAQGNSQGLGRFPVYSDRLWLDIDAQNSLPQEIERVKAYVRELTRQFQLFDFDFTVWDSGSKGFHICIKIEPMLGKDVPWSQLTYVQQNLKVLCDYSLYQHGRLLSNPGRVHPKTGRRKTKVYSYQGKTILSIPIVSAPLRPDVDSDSLTNADLGRIALNRVSSMLLDAPLPGMRHTTLWSTASQCLEAGLNEDTVFGLLSWANKMLPEPKTDEEVRRCVTQATSQLR